MLRFVRGGWFTSENCFILKKVRTDNPINSHFIQIRCWQRERAEAGVTLPKIANLLAKHGIAVTCEWERPHQIEKTLDLSSDLNLRSLKFRCWHRAIFPGGGPPSIVTSVSLYDRVRDGNGWFTYDWTPANFRSLLSIILDSSLYAEDCTRYIIINFIN